MQLSNRNPLDDVPRHLLLPAVIELGRAGVGVAGEILDLVAFGAVFEQVGDRREVKRGQGSQKGSELFLDMISGSQDGQCFAWAAGCALSAPNGQKGSRMVKRGQNCFLI